MIRVLSADDHPVVREGIAARMARQHHSGLGSIDLTERKAMRVVRICAFLLSLVAPAHALNPDRDIHQLAHRSWGEKDGYPGRSQALAQTTDGFLWIGSDVGLFRFDGVHFERYVPRSGDRLYGNTVLSLLALSDGSLWIAYDGNKICDLRNGNVKCYGKTDGVTSMPTAIVQDHEGTMWANTETGVIRFNGTRWEHIGKDWNFPEDVPSITSEALFVDRQGTLWAGVNHTVFYLKQGSKRFEPTGAFAGWSVSIAEAPDGTMWLPDNNSYVRAISTSVSAKSAAVARCEVEAPKRKSSRCASDDSLVVKIRAANDLFFDRNGSLWMTSDTAGVYRVPHPERLRDGPISKTSDALQKFTSKDGLSADNCDPILQDREGNIWVATRDGLDQFRETALVPVALPTSMVQIGIAPTDGGNIWVAGSENYVARIHGDAKNVSLVPADVFKPYRDPAGVTWFIGNSLEQWKDGQLRVVAPSPDGHFSNVGYWQIAGDRSGKFWAFFDGQGFFSLDHGRWRAWPTPPKAAEQHVANMFSDSTGLIWVSTYEGDILTMDQGKIVDYPLSPASPLRYVTAFAERAPHEIWAGGEGGLVLIDRGHFRAIRPALDTFDVMGIVDAGSDGLWLSTAEGVIHISREEADRALQNPSYHFQFERFDSSDGLPGQTPQTYSHTNPYPTAIQGTDGRIWFTATRGVAWVDPKNIPRNALPPPVSITSVSADGSRYPGLASLRLPAHTANVQIDYSALSLSVPERVRFRYKLDGIDKGWQDVGTRREAYYNNLGPGSYQFHVIACNNDGVWNETGASFDFAIAPAYFQTRWFQASCAAAFLVLLWALYRLRLHQIAREFNVRLEERVGERTRLARDLHDTLLQGFQGLMLRLQALDALLPLGEAKEELEQTLDRADQVVTESRKAVHDLRLSTVVSNDLARAVRAMGDELSSENSATFGFLMEGRVHELHPIVRDEVYRITREALRNAFSHSRAQHIEAEMIFAERLFRLRIRDDGEGIAPAILEDGRPGHYGLRGMRERAAEIGAKLEIWSGMGAGTEIDLRVPGSIAYGKRAGRSRLRLFREKGE
ncbi:MAG TPA: triple tyrosine motif-containing protein [Bryobacteraceae bacterium]|nr:triple tyrosine motif-containing protein [Bryobacteraceae bacterium]